MIEDAHSRAIALTSVKRAAASLPFEGGNLLIIPPSPRRGAFVTERAQSEADFHRPRMPLRARRLEAWTRNAAGREALPRPSSRISQHMFASVQACLRQDYVSH
jgi:hypothetical protein